MDLRYQDIEKIIGIALDLDEGEFPKVQARIRNLRRKCVPKLPRPGTGRQIVYNLSNLRHLYIALVLNRGGLGPEAISMALKDAPADDWSEQVRADPDKSFLAGFLISTFANPKIPIGPVSLLIAEFEEKFWQKFRTLQRILKDQPIIVLDVSAVLTHLEQCFKKAGIEE